MLTAPAQQRINRNAANDGSGARDLAISHGGVAIARFGGPVHPDR